MILFYALYLLQISGSGITQPGQRRENHLDDRQKTSVGSSTDMKPPFSSIGQSPVITPTDAPSANKVLYFHHVFWAWYDWCDLPHLYFCLLVLLLVLFRWLYFLATVAAAANVIIIISWFCPSVPIPVPWICFCQYVSATCEQFLLITQGHTYWAFFLLSFSNFMLSFFDLLIDVEFGSALNIETLVAAAEKRETPIEVL